MQRVDSFFDRIRFFFLEKSIFFPSALLFFIQRRKFEKLLLYAQKNTFFFKKLFIGKSLSYADLEMLPTTTRKDVQNHGADMTNQKLPQWMYGISKGGTSGTTGEPIRFYNSSFQTKFNHIQIMYVYFNIYRSIILHGFSVRKLLEKMHFAEIRTPDALEEKHVYSARNRYFFIDHTNLHVQSREIVEKVFSLQPDVFGCYATSTLEFCHYVEEYGYVGKIRIPYIINGGEVLLEGQKAYVEKVLGGKVYNRYGAAEFGSIAVEQKGVKGYVSLAESFVVEIVDDNNKSVAPGETGRVLVTDLFNYTQPFIRYELGDLALLHEKKGPYIRFSLQGRNRYVMFGAKKLSHFELNSLFAEHAEAIIQYQIVKKSENLIEVHIVKNSLYFEFMSEDIIRHVSSMLGPDIDVKVCFMDSIARMGRGKTLVYIDETVK